MTSPGTSSLARLLSWFYETGQFSYDTDPDAAEEADYIMWSLFGQGDHEVGAELREGKLRSRLARRIARRANKLLVAPHVCLAAAIGIGYTPEVVKAACINFLRFSESPLGSDGHAIYLDTLTAAYQAEDGLAALAFMAGIGKERLSRRKTLRAIREMSFILENGYAGRPRQGGMGVTGRGNASTEEGRSGVRRLRYAEEEGVVGTPVRGVRGDDFPAG